MYDFSFADTGTSIVRDNRFLHICCSNQNIEAWTQWPAFWISNALFFVT